MPVQIFNQEVQLYEIVERGLGKACWRIQVMGVGSGADAVHHLTPPFILYVQLTNCQNTRYWKEQREKEEKRESSR